LDAQDRNKERLESEYHDNGLVVAEPDGAPVNPTNFSTRFRTMLRKCGLRRIRFHDLRHSCASLMLNAGVPMKVASQILGHSTITITADLYTHVLAGSKKEAAMQMGRAIFADSSSNEMPDNMGI
jgi:integrase